MLSIEEATEIYEVRAALEALAGEGFAIRADDAERAELHAVFDELRRVGSEVTREGLLDIKRRFYEIMTKGCRNTLVARMLDQLLTRNAQLRATSLSSSNRLPATIGELAQIMDAIDRRDPVAAAAACRSHVQAAADIAIDILRARDSQAAAIPNGQT
ncbi:GntR family transcriptional regulator [Pandoraea eparura]|uniref:GntR family transcriptional regulator n=1 Tax=Pandoraea eparura TaxID=2508291 RepID=UPI001FE44846|nr:FCD domain-containing protein [Pandoraea eparura]